MAVDKFGLMMRLARELKTDHGHRWGQAVFNAASHIYPKATELARGNPELDPFYNDNNVGFFLEHVLEVRE